MITIRANGAGLWWVYTDKGMESSATLREVIERAKGGEAAAVVVIVGRFRGYALELARALVGDGQLAEDVVQQAFMRAVGSLGSLRDAGAFAGWLRQIVRTECDHIRRRTMRPGRSAGAGECEEVVDGGGSPLDAAIGEEMAEAVRQAVRALPVMNREAVKLYYLDERSCSEVAGILQVPEGTVKRRLYDARGLLRQELSGLMGEIGEQKRRRP